jgi:hypothetical protein
MDITEYVNSVLTGNTNILGIAFNRGYELPYTMSKYVGFT